MYYIHGRAMPRATRPFANTITFHCDFGGVALDREKTRVLSTARCATGKGRGLTAPAFFLENQTGRNESPLGKSCMNTW